MARTILKKLYEEQSKAHISDLVHQFRNAKCKKDENVRTHFEHLTDIREQLASMGKVVDDKDYTDTLLASLPALYNYVVSSISTSARLGSTKLTADIFEQFIINEYDRRRLVGKDSDSWDEALSAADSSKKSGGKDKDKDKDKRKPTECFNCHMLGHRRSKCWAKGRGDEGGRPKKPPGAKDSAAQASDKKEDIEAWAAMVLPGAPTEVAAAAGKACVQAGPGTTTELFDSGALRHMLPFRNCFMNYKEIKPRPIQAADKWIFHTVGLGDLKIEVPNGTSFTPIILKDVFHAPDMGLTIVSINCIARAGYSVKFKGKFCIIQDKAGARVGLIPANQNRLYKVDSIYVATLSEEHVDLAMLHRRLAHIAPDAVRKLVSYGAIEGIKLIDDGSPPICDACKQVKATRKPIRKERKAPLANTFGGEIHSNLWGPAPVHSLGGQSYYATFIDDHTRYMKLTPL